MKNVSILPVSGELIYLENIEHSFSKDVNKFVHLISWMSLALIYSSNGYLINIIKKKKTMEPLDWMFLMDSILCIINSIVIFKVGVVGNYYSVPTAVCLIFYCTMYFINISSKFLSIGIVVYRYVFALKQSMVKGNSQRKTFVLTLFSTILISSTILTGYAVSFRDSEKYYLG